MILSCTVTRVFYSNPLNIMIIASILGTASDQLKTQSRMARRQDSAAINKGNELEITLCKVSQIRNNAAYNNN